MNRGCVKTSQNLFFTKIQLFFLSKLCLDYRKLLGSFQGSEKVVYGGVCQFLVAVMEGGLWVPSSAALTTVARARNVFLCQLSYLYHNSSVSFL